MVSYLRAQEKNNFTRWRRIWVRLQGASTAAYFGICAGGRNAGDGRKNKQDGGIIFFLHPEPHLFQNSLTPATDDA
jgi:hypothetical protein